MKDRKTKKELQMQFKEKEIIGGVYIIRNTIKNKLLLEATTNLKGSENRFKFAQQTGSCVDMRLQKDWIEQGGDGLVFEVVDELKKSEIQTQAEFEADIDLLKGIWLEKLSSENWY